MFKLLKKWWNEWCATQEEMRDAGIILPPPWAGIGSYYDPSLTAYINTLDDRSNTVRTDNPNSKKPRQV
jgi:hypothetical protein